MNIPFKDLANFARKHGNQQVLNSPMGQEMLRVLESGDMTKGAELADNFLNSNNVTREQGMSAAQNFLQSFLGGQK